MKLKEAERIINSHGKKLISEESEDDWDWSDYTIDDFVKEFDGGACVYVAGSAPQHEDYGVAEYPCALTIDGDWLGYTFWEAKEDKKLWKVFVTDQSFAESRLRPIKFNPKPEFVAYDLNYVDEKDLRIIGKQIQDSIGFKEWFRRSNKTIDEIERYKVKKYSVSWY